MALTKIGRLLDKGVIKDQTNLGEAANDSDEYLLYDASTDSLKAIAALDRDIEICLAISWPFNPFSILLDFPSGNLIFIKSAIIYFSK